MPRIAKEGKKQSRNRLSTLVRKYSRAKALCLKLKNELKAEVIRL